MGSFSESRLSRKLLNVLLCIDTCWSRQQCVVGLNYSSAEINSTGDNPEYIVLKGILFYWR